jgi:hypothetical protein
MNRSRYLLLVALVLIGCAWGVLVVRLVKAMVAFGPKSLLVPAGMIVGAVVMTGIARRVERRKRRMARWRKVFAGMAQEYLRQTGQSAPPKRAEVVEVRDVDAKD